MSPFSLLAIILLGANALFLLSNFENVRDQQRWMAHTHEVLGELDLMQSGIKDVESGMRGYLLTQDREFLKPYESGQMQIWEHYNRLKSLTEDNSSQRASLEAAGTAMQKRLDVVRNLQHSFDRNHRITPQEKTIMRSGRLLTDEIHEQVNRMKEIELNLLSERSRGTLTAARNFRFSLAFTTLLSIAFVAWTLQRNWRNQRLAQEEAERKSHETALQSNLAELSKNLTSALGLTEFGEKVLSHLSETVSFYAAHFYLSGETELKRLASFAAEKMSEGAPEKIQLGQGLLGEAARKDHLFEVAEVPADYMKITSSLGQARPQSLLFVPVVFEGRVLGVIEMARFQRLDDNDREVLEKLRSPIAVGLNAALWRDRVQDLLIRTQQQSEELQTQQEELRASNEELEQQSEELQAQQEELRASNEELEQQSQELQAQQVSLNQRNLELEAAKKTADKKAQDLARANQYKSEFLAKMSHELRTPLNSLLILTTLLIENKEQNLTSQQREFVQSIYSAGHDLLGLINDILDLSKIEAQKLGLRPEKFTVEALIQHMQRTFELQMKAKNLEFQIQLAPEIRMREMWSDRQRIEQVLRNFLSNALKFTEKGQVILEVSLGSSPELVVFKVRDTGIGISEDKKEIIFEAFEQADSSVSRRYGGTGLGLTISKELAHLLGGQVRLQSEAGRGSEFSLEIPLVLKEAQETLKESSANENLKAPAVPLAHQMSPEQSEQEAENALRHVQFEKRSLLIIEDDPVFRKTISKVAQDSSFQAVEVATAEGALEVLHRHVPAAILLDLQLPGMSGMAFLDTLKQNPSLRHVPVQIISGSQQEDQAFRKGVDGYLDKPASLEKVKDAIQRLQNSLQKPLKRLLLVEDNDRQREAIVHLISGSDLEVIAVKSGEEACKDLKTEKYDCVILDLELPDFSGFQLLEQLHGLKIPLPPIVIYTGREISAREEEKLRRFSESIIIKGARSPERLLDEVNLFLHRPENVTSQTGSRNPAAEALRDQDKTFDDKTVLVVDDDLRSVFALTNALESWGFNVLIARNGFESLERLEENPTIDVVLMDIMMPRMNGLEAIRRIRELKQFAQLPVIALTAKSTTESRTQYIEAGASDYLPKPVQLGNLRSVLKVWLRPRKVFV